ncbi:MAG: class I SAM-dependent methyltransferase [Rhizobiaceae bacterium]
MAHEKNRSQPQHAPQSRPVQQGAAPARRPASQLRLPETVPVILETGASPFYALLDSGDGQKLEQYGPLTIVRPEGQAIWQRSLPPQAWRDADAVFTGDTDEEGMGRWRFPKAPLGETWPLEWDGISFLGRFTSFRHVGVFPEQAAHWEYAHSRISDARKVRGREVKVLNLFGYTGVASLVAAHAGAQVTHVDASRKAIGWARENQELAGLSDRPVRWICEDAVKFCEREVRRGNTYDAIILDPPQYGRGPKGEVWQLFENLPHMVDLVRELISPKPLFVILTAYAIRSSFFAMHELMQEVFADLGGSLESGELVIRTKGGDRRLSTSMFSRWEADR